MQVRCGHAINKQSVQLPRTSDALTIENHLSGAKAHLGHLQTLLRVYHCAT